MTLAPLLDAPGVIQIHAFAAIAAFAVGVVQLAAPKGTIPHRLVGWGWAGLMLTVAASSLFIHTIRMWGPWSPIHLLCCSFWYPCRWRCGMPGVTMSDATATQC